MVKLPVSSNRRFRIHNWLMQQLKENNQLDFSSFLKLLKATANVSRIIKVAAINNTIILWLGYLIVYQYFIYLLFKFCLNIRIIYQYAKEKRRNLIFPGFFIELYFLTNTLYNEKIQLGDSGVWQDRTSFCRRTDNTATG